MFLSLLLSFEYIEIKMEINFKLSKIDNDCRFLNKFYSENEKQRTKCRQFICISLNYHFYDFFTSHVGSL